MNDKEISYEFRFLSFSTKIERLLKIALLCLALFVLFVQFLFTSTTIRNVMVPTEKLEGVKVQLHNDSPLKR